MQVTTATATGVTFQRERAQDCFEEVLPLLQAHWEETVSPELTLDPDWDRYRAAEDAGTVYAYSLRVDGALQGYALYFVGRSLHSKTILVAAHDLLYVAPAYRGRLAVDFIRWYLAELKSAGVQIVTLHITVLRDFSAVAEHLGFEKLASFWMLRL